MSSFDPVLFIQGRERLNLLLQLRNVIYTNITKSLPLSVCPSVCLSVYRNWLPIGVEFWNVEYKWLLPPYIFIRFLFNNNKFSAIKDKVIRRVELWNDAGNTDSILYNKGRFRREHWGASDPLFAKKHKSEIKYKNHRSDSVEDYFRSISWFYNKYQ